MTRTHTADDAAQERRRRFLDMTEAGKAVLAAEDTAARAAEDASPIRSRGQQGATGESTERRRRFLEMTAAGRAVLAAAAEDAARRGGGR